MFIPLTLLFDVQQAGYCHIEGKCVKNGSLSLMQTVICDTTVNKFNWSYVPTTTTTISTSTTTTTTTTTTTESSNGRNQCYLFPRNLILKSTYS